MNERDALIAAIKLEPADDTRRLAYADWLDEYAQHDRDKATAEFIRMSCTMTEKKAIDRQVGKWLAERKYNGPMSGDGSLNMGRLIPGLAQWVDEKNREYIEKDGKPCIEYRREGRWLHIRTTSAAYTKLLAGGRLKLEFWRGFVRRVEIHCTHCLDVDLPLLIPDQPLCEPVFSGMNEPKKSAKATNIYRTYVGEPIWRGLLALSPPWKADAQGRWNDHDRLRWENWETTHRAQWPLHAVRARWAMCMAMHAAAREIIDGKREPGCGALKTEEKEVAR